MIMVTRTLLGTSFLLRDHIPRHSVTLGLNGTNCMRLASAGRVCTGTGFTLFRAGAGYYNLCGTRVCAGTGIHVHHETTGLPRIPFKNAGKKSRGTRCTVDGANIFWSDCFC